MATRTASKTSCPHGRRAVLDQLPHGTLCPSYSLGSTRDGDLAGCSILVDLDGGLELPLETLHSLPSLPDDTAHHVLGALHIPGETLTKLLDQGLCAGLSIRVDDLENHVMSPLHGVGGPNDVNLPRLTLWKVLVDLNACVGRSLKASDGLASPSDDPSDNVSGARHFP